MIARRRLFALLPALALTSPAVLTGCGWEPLYANSETAAGSADLRAIKVAPIPERVGQMLEIGLRNSFNPSEETTKQVYLLKVTLNTALQDLGIQSQGLGTRGEVQVYANYQLLDITGTKVLQTSAMHATDSFDIQANGYSTQVAEDDAKKRAVEELRHEIVARLILFMQNKPAAS